MITIQILVENKTENELCLGEHGLSLLITTPGRRILFDAGASGACFLHNADALKAPLEEVDIAVVSHGHYDHTGGMPAFAARNSKAPILVHKEAFYESYGLDKGRPEPVACSILWSPAEREALRERLVLTEGPYWIDEDTVVSGTIPLPGDFTPTEVFHRKMADGNFVPDPMDHEQFLAIRNRDEEGNPQGILVFSGCSHRGVLPAMDYAARLFPGEPIRVLVAGMHLYRADVQTIDRLIGQLEGLGVETLLPVHCTGLEAITRIHSAKGESAPIATAGRTFRF